MTARSITTLALVARTVDYGESDRVVTLLSERVGKISAMARSARRSRRRFGGALGLFVVGEALVKPPSRHQGMHALERFDCRENLATAISADVVKVAHGSYLLEAARELWPAEQAEPRVFGLLIRALRALAAARPCPTLLRAFELRLLAGLGLAPSFARCVRCGSGVREGTPVGFSVTQGGVICSACGPHGWPVSEPARRLLLDLEQMDMTDAAALDVAPPLRREVRDLMIMVMQHHLGRELQSYAFISQLAGARAH